MEANTEKLVSIWITAYNHENYISQALDSVLMQKTSFDYEIVVGEDCSKDRTREIVLSYQEKYPAKIKLFLPEKNLGMKAMFEQTYKMCTGKYQAWLDGDDYWTDPFKLQKQIDLMEADKDIVMTFHRCEILNLKTGKARLLPEPTFTDEKDKIIMLEDLLTRQVPILTPSVVVRNILPKELPQWFYSLPYLDRGIYYLLLQYGKAKYISEVMAVYREHNSGAWSGLNKVGQMSQSIHFYQILKKHLTSKTSSPLIKRRLRQLAYEKFRWNLKTKPIREIVADARIYCKNLF